MLVHTTVRVLRVFYQILPVTAGLKPCSVLPFVFERLARGERIIDIESRAPRTTAQPHPSWQI